MILDLHRQGLSVSAIARRVGIDRKTVRKYIERGLEPPSYGPRQPRARRGEPFEAYLRQRVTAYPGLTASRLLREICEHGYTGGYTAVTDFLREVRPSPTPPFEVRFETPAGEQAQVDFAHFEVIFTECDADRLAVLNGHRPVAQGGWRGGHSRDPDLDPAEDGARTGKSPACSGPGWRPKRWK